jgi:threonine dehydratase
LGVTGYTKPVGSPFSLDLPAIEQARERIGVHLRRTPLRSSATLSRRLGANVHLKLELFQKTGSFKTRGAFNKALGAGLKRGDRVLAASGGNHAQAVAYMARTLGLHATVFMPLNTPANYMNATVEYGAEVVLAHDIGEAFDRMAQQEKEGGIAIHPFDDPFVMAGQGTVGLEILEDLPEVTDLVVSIGGGGFICGIATAAKALKPSIRIWGVETVGADSMSQALAAGAPVRLPEITSIAKTLGAPSVSKTTLGIAQKHLESVTVVPDAEAVAAMHFILERTKLLTEPAAACTLAAADRLRSRFHADGHVVLVLCGGNVSLSDLCSYRLPETRPGVA